MHPQFKLHLRFTKAPSIYKLCLLMPEEHKIILNINILEFPKLRYRAHDQKCKTLLNCTESLKQGDINTWFIHGR